MDLTPLRRHPDYRLLYLAQSVSFLGTMLTFVALPYQMYQLTHSSLQVGLLGLAELIPLLATAFIGGALADSVDRRRMVTAGLQGRSCAGRGKGAVPGGEWFARGGACPEGRLRARERVTQSFSRFAARRGE